ncbi:MAG TPA: hypothetical protein VF407_19815 [Polyangiaceae bacterium]
MRLSRFARLLFAIAASTTAGTTWVGCQGEDAVVCAPAVDEGKIEQACPEYAVAICDLDARCTQDAGGGTQGCVLTYIAHCEAQLRIAGADAGATERCTSALATTSCDDYAARSLPADCVALPGPLAEGQPCSDGAQCASSGCEQVNGVLPDGGTAPVGCGRCTSAAASGGTCPCAAGFECVDGACQPHPSSSVGSCPAQCGSGGCVMNFGGGVICYSGGAEGESCIEYDRENGARPCAPGLFCQTSCSNCGGKCVRVTASMCADILGVPAPTCVGN